MQNKCPIGTCHVFNVIISVSLSHHLHITISSSPYHHLIISKSSISSSQVPVMFSISGLFDVEWRVLVSCRDGKIYSIKNGDVRGSAVLTGSVIDPGGNQVVSIQTIDKSVWVACNDRTVNCYTFRGKRILGITISDADIVDLAVLAVKKAKIAYCLLVALSDGEIRMYKETTVIYSFKVDAPVISLLFGQYGKSINLSADLSLSSYHPSTHQPIISPVSSINPSRSINPSTHHDRSITPIIHQPINPSSLYHLRITPIISL